MVEDWSRAISSAREGKIVARRGEVGVGVQRVVLQMGIVGVGCCGCVLVVGKEVSCFGLSWSERGDVWAVFER